MAHEIETMTYVDAVPWHGLGIKVEEGIDLDAFRRSAGLDWEVSKRPVQFFGPSAVREGHLIGHTFKDKFVLARNTDDRPYAVVTGRYKPVQPKEIFEFFRDLLDQHGMKMHTAGSLMNGARIWALAKTGDSAFIRGLDKVDSYLLLSTSYDLKLSTLAQFTSVRVVCNNTLQQALRGSAGRVTIPHIQDFNAESVKDGLGIGREQWHAFTSMLNVFAKTKLDVTKALQVVSKVFELPSDPGVPSPERVHAHNVVSLFGDGRFKGADLAGQTAWGLLNSLTEYVDHTKRARSQDNRISSAWFGPGAALKADMVEELQLLAA